jgi:hypothetical protein
MLIVLVTIGDTPSPPTGERNSQLTAAADEAVIAVTAPQRARPSSERNGSGNEAGARGAMGKG